MNISIKELNSMRSSLEKEYEKIEKEIVTRLKKDQDVSKLIENQNHLDERIDLIDRIVHNLNETPKLYERLIDLTDK